MKMAEIKAEVKSIEILTSDNLLELCVVTLTLEKKEIKKLRIGECKIIQNA